MKVSIFSTKSYDRQFFTVANTEHQPMLINTGRGALIDTKAIIVALKSGQIGSLGLDVYEQESELFFEDLSDQIIQDDTFARLMTFPNVIITGHQGFFTEDALRSITYGRRSPTLK